MPVYRKKNLARKDCSERLWNTFSDQNNLLYNNAQYTNLKNIFPLQTDLYMQLHILWYELIRKKDLLRDLT